MRDDVNDRIADSDDVDCGLIHLDIHRAVRTD
jgi:hypothetical protein